MKNIPLLIGTILGTLLLIVGVAFFFSQGTSSTGAVVVDPAEAIGDARHSKGSDSASVTIVEFSDLQCPACKAAQPLLAQILSENPETVRVVYRHFPLDNSHRNARVAAQAAEVASEYGKFWEFHDLLFANQETWGELTDKDKVYEAFGEYAAQLEIDKTEFKAKIELPEIVERVQLDVSAATKLKVAATPTFFVNGVQTSAPDLRATIALLLQNGANKQK